jgi:hypothetical protein
VTKERPTEKGPLTQAQIDKTYKEAYENAYANPNKTNVNPDIMCEKGQPKCSTSFSRDYANEDYKPQGGTKTGDNQSSGGSSGNTGGSTSGGQSGGNKNPTTPPSKSTTEVEVDIDHTPAGTFAGDPTAVTKPGEMIASFDNNDLVSSPISRCLMGLQKEITIVTDLMVDQLVVQCASKVTFVKRADGKGIKLIKPHPGMKDHVKVVSRERVNCS